jgi:RNA polymerase sigma-70 factor (ECF subfamily)
MRADRSAADEARQRIRVRLLVGEEEEEAEERLPRILQYEGRGPLDGWLRVAVNRELLSDLRRGVRETELDDVLLASPAADPEMELLRRRHLEHFRAVFKEVVARELAALGPEQRNLLRWHLVDDISLRKIAILRGTNVSAVAREFARLRASVMASVQLALRERTGLPAPDVDAIITALASRISLSIGAILGRD